MSLPDVSCALSSVSHCKITICWPVLPLYSILFNYIFKANSSEIQKAGVSYQRTSDKKGLCGTSLEPLLVV